MKISKTVVKRLIKETYSEVLTEIFNTTDIYPFKKIQHPASDFGYRFISKDNLEYIVAFGYDEWGGDEIDISFYVNHEDYRQRMKMTNKLDFKVYSTVAAVVRHFNETETGSVVNQVYIFDPSTEFDGDKRRERAYVYILKKNGFYVYRNEDDNLYFTSDQKSIDNQINESSSLLNEIFNTTDIYPFKKMSSSQSNRKHRLTSKLNQPLFPELADKYKFVSKDDLEYIVAFEKNHWSNDAIDISFIVNNVDFDGTFSMTNKLDFKVYSTVAAIARHFDKTELVDDKDKTYTFEASKEFDNDKRRERVYLYILKKNGFRIYRDDTDTIYFKAAATKGSINEMAWDPKLAKTVHPHWHRVYDVGDEEGPIFDTENYQSYLQSSRDSDDDRAIGMMSREESDREKQILRDYHRDNRVEIQKFYRELKKPLEQSVITCLHDPGYEGDVSFGKGAETARPINWIKKYGSGRDQISTVMIPTGISGIYNCLGGDIKCWENAERVLDSWSIILGGFPVLMSTHDVMSQTLTGLHPELVAFQKQSGISKSAGGTPDIDNFERFIASRVVAEEVVLDNWFVKGIHAMINDDAGDEYYNLVRDCDQMNIQLWVTNEGHVDKKTRRIV